MKITRTEIYILVGLLVGGMVFHALWTTKTNVDKAEQVKADVQQQIAAGQKDLNDKLAAIVKDRDQAKTPAQVVEKLPQYIPLPQPIYLQAPQTQPSTVSENKLPDAPKPQPDGSLVIPAASVEAFWNHETACREDSLKLGECQKELPLVTQRAEAAEKAMKGGGLLKRLKGNADFFAIGGAVALGVACGTGHCK